MATRSSAQAEISTREYGLRVAPKSTPKAWNYAYSRGAGADRGKRPSYPIDPKHVAAALSLSSRPTTAGSARTVRGAIAKKYGSVAKGLAAHRAYVASHGGRSGGRSTTRAPRPTHRPAPAVHRPARASTRRAV